MNRLNLRGALVAGLAVFGALAPAAPAFAAPAQPISEASITPTSVEAGTSGHSFTVTYQVSSSAFRGYAGSQIPAGWTRPQRSAAASPGYVEAVPGSCTRISLAYVSASTTGPWTVAIDANCRANQTFSLRYSGVTAPTTAGPNTFASGSLLNSSSTIQPVSSQPVVTVQPGPAATLAVEGFPSPTTAGTQGQGAVVGVDQYGNRDAPLSGNVVLTSSDPAAALPAPAPVGPFNATLFTAGTHSLTATSATTPSITGTQSGIVVQPAALSRIELAPAEATVPASVPQPYTAEGFDAYGNSRGAVTPVLSITPTGSCANGACSDSATGAHTVTGAVGGISDTASLDVVAGEPVGFELRGLPADAAAGQSLTLHVRAVDQFGNTASDYDGSVLFSSTDANAALPARSPLNQGQGQFPVSLRTVGTQTITVADAAMPALTSTSSPVEVAPGPAARIVLDPRSTSVEAGQSVTYTAREQDAYGNDRGAVTPILSISPDGFCEAMTCTTMSAGTKSVTANHNGIQGGAVINVSPEVITVLPETLPGAAVTEPYSAAFTADGAIGNTIFTTAPGGQLPPGLSLSSTGVLSGTPAEVGTFAFTVVATDANNVSGQRDYELAVRDAFTVSPSPADYGPVAVTNFADRTITVTNNSSRTVSFNSVGVNDDWHFPTFAGCFGNRLEPGASCTQTPRFQPNTEGPHFGTLNLGWFDVNDTSRAGAIRVPLLGLGTPRFSVDPTPVADFGSVAVTNFADRTITVTNNGGQAVSFNSVGVNDDWHFPTFAGCFGTTLAPGASCTQTPRFSPQTEGQHNGLLNLGWNDPSGRNGTITVPLVGVGTPEFTAAPSPADFGTVAVTSFSDQTITVTNNGTRTISFNSVSVNDDWHFPTFAGCFGTQLAPGASCTQTPRFQPDNEGQHSGAFRLGWYDTANTSRTGSITVPMTGLAAPELSASPSPADFGSVAVTNFADRTITVTNNGTRTVSFNSVSVNDDWHFPTFAGCFGTQLAPGGSCTQTPRFQPDNTGFHSGTFNLGYYDTANTGRTGSITVPMTGLAAPELSASPSPADFGSAAVTNFSDRTITVTNNGTRTVSFNSVSVNDDWHFPTFAGCFGTTLAPGASCTQAPRFQPQSEGFHSGTFSLGYYDQANTSRTGAVQVPLRGVGTDELRVTPNPVDFGSAAVTNFADRTITVTNRGTRTVSFNSVSVNDDWHFPTFAGCFGTQLAPGASCTQTPRFQPDNEGLHNGTFTLGWYDTANTGRTGALTAAMTGTGAPDVVVTPNPADFGAVSIGQFSDRTLTVENRGTRTVSFNSVSVDDDWHFPTFAGCFGTQLAPGASCTQTPRFQPDTEGPHNGTFRLGWHDQANTSRTGTAAAAMQGYGAGEIAPSAGTADYGDVAVTNFADRTITVTNNGTRTVSFNSVSVNDDWHFPTFAGCFGTNLAPGASCTQTPRFQPDNEGAHTGTFRLGWYDTADTSRTGAVVVALAGRGTPELTASPSPLAYGDVAVGSFGDQTVTVTNHGTRTVSFNSVSVNDDWHFPTFAGCFGTQLAPGASCTQTPRFQPNTDGPHTGTLRVGWYDTANTSRAGAVVVPMTGYGV